MSESDLTTACHFCRRLAYSCCNDGEDTVFGWVCGYCTKAAIERELRFGEVEWMGLGLAGRAVIAV